MMWQPRLICIVLVVVLCIQLAHSKGVYLNVATNWEETPIILEAIEALSHYQRDSFWTFTNAYLDAPSLVSAKDQYEFFRNYTSQLDHQPYLVDLLDYTVSTRYFNPTVVMHGGMATSDFVQFNEPSRQCHEDKTFVLIEWREKSQQEESQKDQQETLQVRKELFCDVQEAIQLIQQLKNDSVPQSVNWLSDNFPNEHIFSNIQSQPIRATLYVDFVSGNNTKQFLQGLQTQSITLRVRYLPQRLGSKVSLQGYGAELTLKDTEYRTVDDSEVEQKEQTVDTIPEDENLNGVHFAKLIQRLPEYESELLAFRKELQESNLDGGLRQLKKWEMSDLGIQAAFCASRAENKWKLLSELTGYFPSLAASLSKIEVPKEFVDMTHIKSQQLGEGAEYGLLNGRLLDLDTLNPFSLYKVIEDELSTYHKLEMMDIPEESAKALIALSFAQDQSAESIRIDFRSSLVKWLNDLETEPAYKRWPLSLRELFKPSPPDQIKFIRKNILNLVFVLDPTSEEALSAIPVIHMFVTGSAPLHIGVIFQVEEPNNNTKTVEDEPLSNLIAGLFNYLNENHSNKDALTFLKNLATGVSEGKELDINLISQAIEEQSSSTAASIYKRHKKAMHKYASASLKFLTERGVSAPKLLINGIPQRDIYFDNEGITAAVRETMIGEYNSLQRDLWYGQVTDTHDLYAYFFSKPNTYTIYNDAVMSHPAEYIPLVGISVPLEGETRPSFALADSLQRGVGEFLFRQLDYLRGDIKKERSITHLLLLDLSTRQGLQTLINAAQRYPASGDTDDTDDVQFAVIHNSACVGYGEANYNPVMTFEDKQCFTLYADIINVVSKSLTPKKYLQFVQLVMPKFIQSANQTEQVRVDVMKELSETVKPGLTHRDQFVRLWKNEAWKKTVRLLHQKFISEIISPAARSLKHNSVIEPGTNYIITNGRITKIPHSMESFPVSGFRLLEQIEHSKANNIIDILTHSTVPDVVTASLPISANEHMQELALSMQIASYRSYIKMACSSLLLSKSITRYPFPPPPPPSSPKAKLHMYLVLDPLSKVTRRVAPIIADLESKMSGFLAITAELNPKKSLSELPLSSYYRYAIDSEVRFDEEGTLSLNHVDFVSLPSKTLLTLGLDAEPTWMVHAKVSPHDLDNLLLQHVPDDFVFAEFELKNLVIEGSAFDDDNLREPPKGLELQLQNTKSEVVSDTLVMYNFGYFQLKANPGAWTLHIAPGRSERVFAFSTDSTSDRVYVDNFAGVTHLVHVHRQPGFELVNVLDEPLDHLDSEETKTIHVFSLASGHVYERFLKIMMLSVLKTTKEPVKFWFVENFLSPKFKQDIANMQKTYTFEYELVSYHWPSWLHAQTEKQRVIWAYKILFLDVLFPLDVHRVIFVDADLVVRADLKELNELDLEGAPYGYAPMGNSRKEMEGFRFWNQGFWKDYLAQSGSQYHISALYVVDLDNFRNSAAGDQLRRIYSQLSKDPNSLANLDQDLPNYTQSMIPIYSLDESWLWCETWCDDESKKKAKAIDLCNNPMTKTPKLENAVRIVPEWTALDAEAKEASISGGQTLEINPLHRVIAQNLTDDWLVEIKAFLKNVPDVKTKVVVEEVDDESADEEDKSGSWFGSLISDIL